MIDNLFLCVGAQKAGTTWLNSQLNDHPDVGFSDVKEVHYFNTVHNASVLLTRRKVEHIKNIVNKNPGAVERYFSNLSSGREVDAGLHRLFSPVDDEWYISLFKSNHKKYCADFSPEYALIGVDGYENVKSVSKNQKIVFMMRDPVDRALSAIRYFYKMSGRDIASVSYEELNSLANSDLIIGMSSYEKTVLDLFAVFSKHQVLFLFYEEVMGDKQGSIDKVCDFLDIEKVVLSAERMNRRVNSTEAFDIPAGIVSDIEKRLSGTYGFMKKEFEHLPSKWRC